MHTKAHGWFKLFKKFLKYTKEDSLVRDSFILCMAMFLSQAMRFFYHFFMGRALGPSNYGILSVLLSISYFISVPIYVIQNSITKFVAEHKVKGSVDQIGSILRRGLKFMFFVSLVLIVSFVFLIPFLSDFFLIPAKYFYFWAVMLFFALLLPVLRGVFQGMQLFGKLGVNIVLEGIFVLVFGAFLVWKGFGLTGAVIAVVLAYALPFFLAFIPLRSYFKLESKEKFSVKDFFSFTWPMLLALSFMTMFYTIDLFLVKHFFSAVDAGYYAAISLLGKIVFFAANSITMVMFPKLIDFTSRKKDNFILLKKSLLIISLLSFLILVVYFLLGDFVVWVLFGSAYIWISKYIAWFGLAMAFFSLAYTLALYNLSFNRNGFIYFLLVLLVLEFILLTLFHSSLAQVLVILLLTMFLLFIFMVLYSIISRRKLRVL